VIRRGRAWWWLLLLLGGCAWSGFDITANPARVPASATAPDSRTPGRIALVVPEQVQRTVIEVQPKIRLHAGAIVEQAARVALMGGLTDGVAVGQDVPPADAGYDGTLKVDVVLVEYKQRVLWFIPTSLLAGITRYESSVRLSFEASLLDAKGRVIWTRAYSEVGRETWSQPSMETYAMLKAIEAATHDVAWRLSREATKDVRAWLQAERAKPRDL
jgi:hypothetical protein